MPKKAAREVSVMVAPLSKFDAAATLRNFLRAGGACRS
jgi:hypothetical protein